MKENLHKPQHKTLRTFKTKSNFEKTFGETTSDNLYNKQFYRIIIIELKFGFLCNFPLVFLFNKCYSHEQTCKVDSHMESPYCIPLQTQPVIGEQNDA